MSVGRCQDEVDAEEFEEWSQFCAYYEPFGDEWRQTAMVCTVIAQANAKKGKTFRVEDFMPLAKVALAQQTPEQMLAVLRLAAATIPGGGKK